jgi:hypothetical protein
VSRDIEIVIKVKTERYTLFKNYFNSNIKDLSVITNYCIDQVLSVNGDDISGPLQIIKTELKTYCLERLFEMNP